MNDIPTKIDAISIDEFGIVIDGTKLTQFSNEQLLLTVDHVGSGFSFTSPFFPETKTYRDLFRPFGYQSVQAYIGGNIVFNGTMILVTTDYNDSKNSVNVQCRSLPGRILDCTFEQDDFNGFQYLENGLQFEKQDLEQISSAVVSKFGMNVSFPDGAGAIFETASPESVTTTIFAFLQNLARQRKLLMSQTVDGKLLFHRANTTGNPIAELIEGQQGVMISTAEYDSQKRFSEYNVFGQQHSKNDNFALVNDTSIPVLRPKSLMANDTNAGNIIDSAEWALSSDLANSISIPLSYEGWIRPDGKPWAENQLVTVKAPSIMIYKPYVMLIKSVLFKGTPNSKVTDFELTIPESYTGKVPTEFPWEE